ncbi:MAG TPA: NAD(+)--rifampin ADP-ribosyltransferase [Bacteroidia bacterium]|jgi:rifampin ADP-ribosylating transferase
MEFSPNNNVVKLCLQGMAMEETGKPGEAAKLFLQAWSEAINDLEKFLAAHFISRHQNDVRDKLKWLETTLQLALRLNNEVSEPALPLLYSGIAKCYEESGDHANAKKNFELAALPEKSPSDKGPFYHGTRADLKIGDLLKPGFGSNYKADLTMNHIYFTALPNGAGLAAALAGGDGRERVYIVEPAGSFENDPNVTNKKFPGNPTRSYRTAEPLKIVGELKEWVRQTPEQIRQWKERLANNKGEIIN